MAPEGQLPTTSPVSRHRENVRSPQFDSSLRALLATKPRPARDAEADRQGAVSASARRGVGDVDNVVVRLRQEAQLLRKECAPPPPRPHRRLSLLTKVLDADVAGERMETYRTEQRAAQAGAYLAEGHRQIRLRRQAYREEIKPLLGIPPGTMGATIAPQSIGGHAADMARSKSGSPAIGAMSHEACGASVAPCADVWERRPATARAATARVTCDSSLSRIPASARCSRPMSSPSRFKRAPRLSP